MTFFLTIFMCSNDVLATSRQKLHINDLYLVPGGETIGIEIATQVIVVDSYSVESENGYINPASQSGIKKGDIILNIDGRKINRIEDVKEQMLRYSSKNNHNLPMNIIIKRDSQYLTKKLYPVQTKDGNISLGLYLKDSILGIGTLTFVYEDQFGALGHPIQDQNEALTERLLDEGVIKKAVVTNIIKGTKGNPGEKKAKIDQEPIGTITQNTTTGIFGDLQSDFRLNKEKMKIAPREAVRPGDAQILTVINGDKVESFDVKIIEVKNQPAKDVKGIKLKITDERLLNKTGGIVQGMSGSPIIQNNRIVGAVTHVLIDDQTTGYGIFIEFMLEELGIEVIK